MARRIVALLLTGLAGCAAQPSGDWRASQEACRAAEEGATAQANVNACTAVILGADSEQERINAYNFRGVIYSQTGREELAMADFDEAIRLAPDFSAAHNNRANLLSRQGRLEAAERDYEAALSSGPRNATAYNNYAWHLLEKSDYDAALPLAEQAVRLEPQKASNHDTLAHALMGLGRGVEAEQSFATAMELDGVEVVRRYQNALTAKGYSPGRSDGVLDGKTQAALASCIRDNCRLLLD